jgi:hypothetical protein
MKVMRINGVDAAIREGYPSENECEEPGQWEPRWQETCRRRRDLVRDDPILSSFDANLEDAKELKKMGNLVSRKLSVLYANYQHPTFFRQGSLLNGFP